VPASSGHDKSIALSAHRKGFYVMRGKKPFVLQPSTQQRTTSVSAREKLLRSCSPTPALVESVYGC